MGLSLALPTKRPTVSELWLTMSRMPAGKTLFSKLIGTMAPYTGSIPFTVLEARVGHATVELRDTKKVRNHLNSVHAIALMNLGEVSTGLAMMFGIDGRGRGIITHLEMDYVAKARGNIRAVCDAKVPDTSGSHDCEVEALLKDTSGQIVAVARAVWRGQIDG